MDPEALAGPAVRRATVLALVVAATDAAIPILPLYGNGHQTVFSFAMPGRFVLQWLVGGWGSVVVVLVGVALLSRGHGKIAAGIFVATALGLAFEIVTHLIVWTDLFTRWQSVLVLCLEAAEVALLLVAVRVVLALDRRVPAEP